uniref:Extracellular superoxide dismutase [Cu-Zn] n=1 Tax=Strigamia maritima TaxID=126957 RepID=T1J9L3_STRMM
MRFESSAVNGKMEATAKVEFAVQMTCQNCVDSIERVLSKVPEIKNISINLKNEQVIVETSLSVAETQNLIESSGLKAVFKGFGTAGGNPNFSAAVAMLSGRSSVIGVVRFLQIKDDKCLIDGTIDGLSPGEHGLHVHELGDLSNGCQSVGNHYNPFNKKHGGRDDTERHVGDLGNVTADKEGRATFRFEDKLLCVPNIIGRSLVITADRDDLGKRNVGTSSQDGNSGARRLACGVIARSPGIFENPKKICLCDGTSIWDETNPLNL